MPLSASLEIKIKSLAEEPGVYLMKDHAGSVLYVGKAKNLKSRVSSYFQEARDKAPRIELLVRKISDFEVVITDTEVEALVLECNLIKKYRPRFNVRLKDDKTYPYVRIDVKHPFPRLEYVRRTKKDGARYFGPYVTPGELRDILRWAQKTLKLRDCSDNAFRNRSRPCILFEIGQCSAPCVGLISAEDYGRNIEQALKLLDGKSSDVLKEMKKQMTEAADREQFELAAALRDRIQHIEVLNQEQKIVDPESDLNRDIIHFARSEVQGQAVTVVMAVRHGHAVGVFQFPFNEMDPSIPDDQFLFEFMAQYYLPRYEQTPQLLPKEVLMPAVQGENDENLLQQTKVLSQALGRRVEFRVPKRGEAADLLAMVKKTAAHKLTELATRAEHIISDLADVQKRLDLKTFPRRIECFDISHFQGQGTVASRIVFMDGKPDKTLYRHYHVRDVSGPDDFKSMREVLERRFMHDQALPHLLIVDGGKGQLAQAEAIFEELGIVDVELASLAKARTESGFKDPEVASSMERVFKPGQKNPIMLKPGTGAYRILTQARDESHRFAITFHRRVRDRSALEG